ncbi:peptidoglycan DD-metalloendopeptidase family protein [Vibrio pelagius]|uniref:Peptidoglycan DD-metalloendopeptidase family protein n=1 Tax=Vibrio pelagius TaxID=28169 RepID=A0ABY5G7W6_VIBPE|nr:peptidoglycan DD-metalloendopeptidase family protein [Vibrio pelagius]UTT85796.1 peptidoglycan DD-metalloendopeptidase family protein [Vibrio pelagius]
MTKTMKKIKAISSLILLSSAMFSISTHAASQGELKGVKSEISRQQQALSSQQKKLDSLQANLKQQELSIASLEKGIKERKEQLATANANIQQLNNKIQALITQKQVHTQKLEQLIQTYYMTRRAKAPSHILNTGVEDDRISHYYQHLAKARTTTIKAIEQTQAELEESQRLRKAEQEQIATLLKQQTTKRDQLAKTQAQRKKTVGSIKKRISGDKTYLAELQRNETRLKAEIAKAEKAARERRNAVPMDGLAKRKGKLPWPIKGKVLHNYGTRQTGQVNWKGMVINASYGQQVKSVYSGTVVFAEYLRGYGLVVLLDHGKGDMTLYGFNQALLKKEGDKVKAGEAIALAGDTGGQSRPSLYFEIRRNSQAQNPKSWLVR